MSGPIGLARSQVLIIQGSSSLLHFNRLHHFKSRECQKHLTSIESIALSKAYDPIILVIRENIKELVKTIQPHATRYEAIPINVIHKHI